MRKIIWDKYNRNYHFQVYGVENEGLQDPEQMNNTPKNIFNSLLAYCTLSFGNLDELSCYLHSEVKDVKSENLLIWWKDY